jgi:hypothetical protein
VKTGGEMQLRLRRHGDEFQILRKFGYRDPGYVEPFIVPADPEHFRTDLASIPWVFAWLVPGLGTHLPAVLLHDALVVNGGKDHEGRTSVARKLTGSSGTPCRTWPRRSCGAG